MENGKEFQLGIVWAKHITMHIIHCYYINILQSGYPPATQRVVFLLTGSTVCPERKFRNFTQHLIV